MSAVAMAIFVKTPGQSPVKTRLARNIGPEQAAACYLRCARAVHAVAQAAQAGPVYWAVAEERIDASSPWTGLPMLQQGPGGLGERMAHVHELLVKRHGAGILLGADSPQIETSQLERAADWLGHHRPRQVIGPASDGGFWLFGANRGIEQKHWVDVEYSTRHTLAQFRRALDGCGERLELDELTDLDDAGDLEPVTQGLEGLQHALPMQRQLATWLRSVAQPYKEQP
jgi:uncharacterized protein